MLSIKLNDGTQVPILAFGAGTALIKGSATAELNRNTVDMLKKAIAAGYRHLDTAEFYHTEEEVGAAIRESLDEGVIENREELFITTKISEDFFNPQKHIDMSLQKLGLQYVDLYLIHSPLWAESREDIQKAWAGMEEVKDSGKAKSIGVSGFEPSHLEAISETFRIPPSINQLEYHPYFSKREGKPFLEILRSQGTGGVSVAAYGAMAPLTKNIPGPLDATLEAIAAKHGVTPDLVCFRWCIDQDVVVVTTTRRPERIKEYLRVFDFKLSRDEIEEIHRAGQACVAAGEPMSRARKYFEFLKMQEKEKEQAK